ncbi:MAG: DUF6671 family protein [Nitriliruptoraceae bacterium]
MNRTARPDPQVAARATDARRVAVLTTKHGKGPVIAAGLAPAGIEVRTLERDTDLLGTFSGEVERPGPPLETAVRKARLGMQATGTRLGVASEGTFGPDPALPWVTRNVEMVVLVDDLTDTTVVGRATSLTTRSFAVRIGAQEDLAAVLSGADLPRHAVIVAPASGPPRPVFKGLRTTAEVTAAVAACAAHSPDGLARIETDLRADRCPSRLEVIAAAVQDLAVRLGQHCPACGAPGWGAEETLTGLPCGWCAAPTTAPRAVREACPTCGHAQERGLGPPGATADPASCPNCNP